MIDVLSVIWTVASIYKKHIGKIVSLKNIFQMFDSNECTPIPPKRI
jgi:hypothetical protein